MSDTELTRFYQAKAKEVTAQLSKKEKKEPKFGYDEDGNLTEQTGGNLKTIPLPTYRAPNLEELDEMEKVRIKAIAMECEAFDKARSDLYQAIHTAGVTDPSIVSGLNRKVQEADQRLQLVRFPLRNVAKVYPIKIRDLDFNQLQEVRKFPYKIAILETNPFPLQDQYVRIGIAAPRPLVSVEEARAAVDETVLVFAEPDSNPHGYLSLSWPVDLIMSGRPYRSAKQALAGELAMHFKDEVNYKKISEAETADAVSYSVEDTLGGKDKNQGEWNKKQSELIYSVNRIKFTAYPALAKQLLDTKYTILGAYLPNDTILGIGISINDPKSTIRKNWSGQNELGQALMKLREEIRANLPKKKPGVAKPGIVKSKAAAAAADVPSSLAAAPVASVPATALVPAAAAIVPASAPKLRRPGIAPATSASAAPAIESAIASSVAAVQSAITSSVAAVQNAASTAASTAASIVSPAAPASVASAPAASAPAASAPVAASASVASVPVASASVASVPAPTSIPSVTAQPVVSVPKLKRPGVASSATSITKPQ
jgi:ribA/ribD-fused uncharacterized protein